MGVKACLLGFKKVSFGSVQEVWIIAHKEYSFFFEGRKCSEQSKMFKHLTFRSGVSDEFDHIDSTIFDNQIKNYITENIYYLPNPYAPQFWMLTQSGYYKLPSIISGKRQSVQI